MFRNRGKNSGNCSTVNNTKRNRIFCCHINVLKSEKLYDAEEYQKFKLDDDIILVCN